MKIFMNRVIMMFNQYIFMTTYLTATTPFELLSETWTHSLSRELNLLSDLYADNVLFELVSLKEAYKKQVSNIVRVT